MPYTSNPHIAKTRRKAVNDVRLGRKTQAEAARSYGVHKSTIGRWLKVATKDQKTHVETKSSAPHRHSNETDKWKVERVISLREETGRCAQILHAMLKAEGLDISLSTVKRVLKRNHLTRRRKQLKPRYAKIPRPWVTKPGDLVEMDTIHYLRSDGSRFYIYAVIDIYSRLGYVEYRRYLSASTSYDVAKNALKAFRFKVGVIQTDNGGEFSEELYFRLKKENIQLRHTRPRRPNDNAHVERFIRTIQEECFRYSMPNEAIIRKQLKNYLNFYNTKRFHLGLNCNIPSDVVAKVMS